jgi:predicted nucleic acid-binding protein
LIYLDSCLVIYLVEDHPVFGPQVSAAIASQRAEVFATSPLVRLECLVGPRQAGDVALERDFEAALARFHPLPIVSEAFDAAASLRARHGLRTPDALHLATALRQGCSHLWTNDERFGTVADGFVVPLSRLAPGPGSGAFQSELL